MTDNVRELAGPDNTREPSQKQRVLTMLQNLGPVCGTRFLRAGIPRYAARIHELRTDGYPIETRPCSDIAHLHETAQTEYLLRHAPTTLFDPREV